MFLVEFIMEFKSWHLKFPEVAKAFHVQSLQKFYCWHQRTGR